MDCYLALNYLGIEESLFENQLQFQIESALFSRLSNETLTPLSIGEITLGSYRYAIAISRKILVRQVRSPIV
jgi:hypothetical protein